MRIRTRILFFAVAMLASIVGGALPAAEWTAAITTLRDVSPVTGASAETREAWKELAAADALALPTILIAMRDTNPVAENWLRSAADAVAEHTLAAGKTLPVGELESLVNDTSATPRGRMVAFEWLTRVDPTAKQRLLPKMLNDPSLDLRYDAIAYWLEVADKKSDKEFNLGLLNKLLRAARDLEQIKEIKSQLNELGQIVDLSRHLGFVTSWRVIGPFDNTDEKGFGVGYPPESQLKFDAQYYGKEGEVKWSEQPVTTDDELGVLDVVETLGSVKGAIAYVATTFQSNKKRRAYVRYGTNNATKVWVNGQLVAEHEVYHAGGEVDQYVAAIDLRKGENTILLKLCQNEQTESWAQEWQFQLRVTDDLAGAIHSAE